MLLFKRLSLLLILSILITQSLACSSERASSEDEAAMLAATLDAIYSQQTQDAQSSVPAESEADAPVEAPDIPDTPDTPDPPPPEPPLIMPEDPPDPERTLEDSDSSLRSYEHRVLSGDNVLNNLYERPFTSVEMIYQPDLDIYTVDFAYDDNFFYFTITLNGSDEDGGGLTGMYGIEFDCTATGRGDLLVMTENPGSDWSLDNVTVLTDGNVDVGGLKPILAEQSFSGNGYDQEVELGGEFLAFSRISPEDQEAVQIAVSRTLLDNPEEFLWGGWADKGMQDFSLFDYNDVFGPNEAGSPFKDNEDYPIKALYSMDNTCRLPFGFNPIGTPGMCASYTPPSKPGEKLTCPPGCWLIGDECQCIR